MREIEPEVGNGRVLRNAASDLKVVRPDYTRERVPGTASEVFVAGGADLIDTMLQAVEGGSAKHTRV